MDGRPRHFLLFYVISTIAGPIPLHPFSIFFISSKVLLLRRWCECAGSHKWRARKSFVIPTCTRGIEGRMEGRRSDEEEEEENFSAILLFLFFFFVISHLIDQYPSE
jgi:hypothetical protein